MAPVDSRSFRTLLRRRSRDEFAAFVAALWAERGWETERQDGLVVARDPETRQRELLLPVAARRTDNLVAPRVPEDPEATTVVLAGTTPPAWVDGDVRVVDAEDLHGMLAYGVDRERALALLSAQFGYEPSGGPVGVAGQVRRLRRLADRAPPGWAVAAAVSLLLVAGLAVGTVLLGASGDGAPTPSPTASPVGTMATPRSTPSAPPGFADGAVENPTALATAHARELPGQYTVEITYREDGENHTGVVRETIQSLGDTRYATRLNQLGTLVTRPGVVSEVEAFANGRQRYERLVEDGNVSYRERPVYSGAVGYQVNRVAGYVERSLLGAETTVTDVFERDGRTIYRVRFEGSADDGVLDARGVALVDGRGVVHQLRRQYRPADDPSVTVTVSIDYTEFYIDGLDEPDWLSEVYGDSTRGTTTPDDGTETPTNESDTPDGRTETPGTDTPANRTATQDEHSV
jgi:hypothetical protein